MSYTELKKNEKQLLLEIENLKNDQNSLQQDNLSLQIKCRQQSDLVSQKEREIQCLQMEKENQLNRQEHLVDQFNQKIFSLEEMIGEKTGRCFQLEHKLEEMGIDSVSLSSFQLDEEEKEKQIKQNQIFEQFLHQFDSSLDQKIDQLNKKLHESQLLQQSLKSIDFDQFMN